MKLQPRFRYMAIVLSMCKSLLAKRYICSKFKHAETRSKLLGDVFTVRIPGQNQCKFRFSEEKLKIELKIYEFCQVLTNFAIEFRKPLSSLVSLNNFSFP